MPVAGRPEPGTANPEQWTPYKLWSGDLWQCDGCGARIISGVGHAAIAEHYQLDFASLVEKLNASQFQVNDC